jgi:hypothetical protein
VASPTYVTIDITSVEVTCLFAGNQLRDCFVNKGIVAVCDGPQVVIYTAFAATINIAVELETTDGAVA